MTTPLKDWFVHNGLTFNETIKTALFEEGVTHVELLKLVSEDKFMSWLADYKPVMKESARLLLAGLKEQPFNHKKTVKEINLVDDSSPQPPKKKSKTNPNLPRHNSMSNSLKQGGFGFTVLRTAEESKKLREQRKYEAKQRKAAGVTSTSAAQELSSDDDDDNDDDDDDAATGDVKMGSNNKTSPNQRHPALPVSKWNIHRDANTDALDPPADEDEKKCWAHEKNILPEGDDCPDLEDPRGLYKKFGCDIRSSSADIKAAFNAKKKEFHALSRTHHPDKAGGDDDMINIFNVAKAEYEELKEAYEILHAVDDDGNCQGRFDYDKSGQDLRRKFLEEFKKRHPSLSFAQRAAQIAHADTAKESYVKGNKTKAARKEEDIVSQIVHAYNCNGHQTNRLRLLVATALLEGHTQADLIRSIRKRAEGYRTKTFDGVVNTCSICKKIKSVIGRIKKEYEKGGLNHLLEEKADLKSKTVKENTRGRKTVDLTKQVEDALIIWCRQMWKESKALTRYIIFHRAMEIDRNFMGGVNSDGYYVRMKNWFYYGFNKRMNLSRRKVSSIGQKLPDDWEAKRDSIIARVAKCQTPRQRGDGLFAVYVFDDDMGNTDQVPIYIESHGDYQWGNKGSDRIMIRTAGKEKDRITIQLIIFKSGRKGRIMIIFKAAAPQKDTAPRRNTVAYEIQHRLADAEGNEYPPEDKCVLHCTPTANSNGEVTLLHYKKVFLPEVGAEDDGRLKRPAGLLLDDFRGHSDKKVKEVTENVDDLHWLIMAGGITPKAQPLDVLVNKVFKGLNYFFCGDR
jgi:hypothetical protein